MGVIFVILFCMWGCILIIRVCCTMWNDLSWDLHRRSRVRVRTCTSCKSLGQPGFYSLTWTHKVYFPENEISSNQKIKKKMRDVMILTLKFIEIDVKASHIYLQQIYINKILNKFWMNNYSLNITFKWRHVLFKPMPEK